MNILALAYYIPMPDRGAKYLRFYEILKILAAKHSVAFHNIEIEHQKRVYGEAETIAYRDKLQQLGIEVIKDGLKHEFRRFLQERKVDAVFIEHFETVQFGLDLDEVRFWQPSARVIVDTVDVNFQKALDKAAVTGKPQDMAEAHRIKAFELGLYDNSDLLIAITEEDKRAYLKENDEFNIEIIPLVHELPPLSKVSPASPHTLVFVGNFEWSANVDAMLYFCAEVLPLIEERVADVKLNIVGNAPPAEIKNLARANVEVHGFVADLEPILRSCAISIAPLRYGGGLKGKVTEAMANGLPVVTTSVGLQGMNCIPGESVMAGDTPQAFADAVVRLMLDRSCYENVRKNAWEVVDKTYSEKAVAKQVDAIFDRLNQCPVKKLDRIAWLKLQTSLFMHKYVLWRFSRKDSLPVATQ